MDIRGNHGRGILARSDVTGVRGWISPDAGWAGRSATPIGTRKQGLVGNLKNASRQPRPKGRREPVRVQDFRIPELDRAVPYGVGNVSGGVGWVRVGVDHDATGFAVNATRSWGQSIALPPWRSI